MRVSEQFSACETVPAKTSPAASRADFKVLNVIGPSPFRIKGRIGNGQSSSKLGDAIFCNVVTACFDLGVTGYFGRNSENRASCFVIARHEISMVFTTRR